MNNWKLAVMALACITAVHASFHCPDDSHSFYHADVSTGCQVYHFCENSQLQTFTCPAGQAFNHETSQCEDASTVNCYETMDHHSHHHHHKRSIEEYHTIDVQEAKEKIIETYNAIKPIVREAVQSIAPTIYEKFDSEYVPAIKKFKNDIMPYVNEKVIPQVRKYSRFVTYIIGQVIEKVHNSYQRSNSTHISIASFSELAKEITDELKPLLDLGKFLSDKVVKKEGRRRHKRDTSESPAESFDNQDFVIEYYTSMFERACRDFFFNEGPDIVEHLIVPAFYHMMMNDETKDEILSVINPAIVAFQPVLQEISRAQVYDSPQGKIVKIPKEMYSMAVDEYMHEIRPFMKKIAILHLYKEETAENVPSFLEIFAALHKGRYPKADILVKEADKFIAKHRGLLQSSTGEELQFYPLEVIMSDFKPVRAAIYENMRQFFGSTTKEKVWMFYLFGNVKKPIEMYEKPLPKKRVKGE